MKGLGAGDKHWTKRLGKKERVKAQAIKVRGAGVGRTSLGIGLIQQSRVVTPVISVIVDRRRAYESLQFSFFYTRGNTFFNNYIRYPIDCLLFRVLSLIVLHNG